MSLSSMRSALMPDFMIYHSYENYKLPHTSVKKAKFSQFSIDQKRELSGLIETQGFVALDISGEDSVTFETRTVGVAKYKFMKNSDYFILMIPENNDLDVRLKGKLVFQKVGAETKFVTVGSAINDLNDDKLQDILKDNIDCFLTKNHFDLLDKF